MQQSFRRDVRLTSSSATVWTRLLDFHTVASWVSILENVRQIEPLKRFTAVLRDRLGPFRLRADLSVEIVEIEDGSRVHIRADGQDRQVRSRITVDAALRVRQVPDAGSHVDVEGTYEVTGRVATLGAGSIRKKASLILDEFFEHLMQELGAEQPGATNEHQVEGGI